MPEPLQLKIKLKTQVGECTKAEKKQKLLSELDSLSCEQEIIDLPTIKTNIKREARM